ncbi:MAG: PQQ-binding-like beta-propeller repeat protein [Acidimicrobiales bacterium]
MVEAWRVGLSEPVSSRPNGGERIVMIGSTVLVSLDRSLVAYDVASGQQLWTLPLAFDGTDPVLPLVVDTEVVVATDTQTLERVDLRTGRRRWQTRIGGVATCSALTSPVANSSHLLVVSHSRCNEPAIDPAQLVAISLVEGTIAWQRPVAGTGQGEVHVSPAVNDTVVVVGGVGDRRRPVSDTYTAYEAGTGALRWTAQFDRDPANIPLWISQAPRLYENAVVVVQVATVLTDIARPAGLDVATGRVLWLSSIGNEVLIGDTLVGLDRVRDSPQQPLAAIGIDVLTGTTRWRDGSLRAFWPLEASSPAALVSDRFVVLDPRSGTHRMDVPLNDVPTNRPLYRRGFVLDGGKAVTVTSTPQTNVTTASTSIQTRDLDRGTTLAAFDEPGFAPTFKFGGDLLVAVLARGPNEQSVIVAYRITRE